MSVQEEITTRRAKSIILNHWIYNYLPFGAILSGVRLSSFTPIAAWLATWLILGITYSSIYTCDEDPMCSNTRELTTKLEKSMQEIDQAFEDMHNKYNTDGKPYDRKFKPEEHEYSWETFDYKSKIFIKEMCSLLLMINLPGIMGGIASFYTIKSARQPKEKINN